MSGLKPTSTNTQGIERAIDVGNDEQQQDLAALQAMAGPAQVQGVEAVPEQVAADLASELAGALTMVVQIAGPMFPSVAEIYKPEVIQAAAGSVAAVCDKHGWLQDGLMGRYGEEIACAAVVGPLAFATYKGIQADIAARQPAQPERLAGELNLAAPEVAAGMPGAKTVSVGVAA